jgi:hypothetical protein
MKTDRNTAASHASATATDAPSADFVRAVSDLLDTDPTDLLAELGYYGRSKHGKSSSTDVPLTAK